MSEVAVKKEELKAHAGYASIPRAIFWIAAALLVMRTAQTFYTPILPLFVRLLNSAIPLFAVGLVTGANQLGVVLVGPLAGRWCDRLGSHRPLLLGVMVMSVACILASFAFGKVDLVLYLLLSGAGYGTATIAALAYAGSVTGPANRATAMSLIAASTLAGAALGPLPGGYIADAFAAAATGYRATFLSGGIVLLVCSAYVFFLVRHWRGKATPAAAQKQPFSSVLKHNGLVITSVATLLWGISYGAFLYFTIPLLGNSLGFNASHIGWIISAFGAGHAIGALVLGPISDRTARRKPFAFMAIFGTGVIILLFSLLRSLPLMVLVNFIMGFVASPCCGIVPAMAAEFVPWAPATGISVQRSALLLGVFLGPMVGGALIGSMGYSFAMVTYGGLALVVGLAFLVGTKEPKLAK